MLGNPYFIVVTDADPNRWETNVQRKHGHSSRKFAEHPVWKSIL